MTGTDIVADITRICRRQCGVLTTAQAIRWIGPSALRWRLASGRWQRPFRGVIVTHSGPLTGEQTLWAAILGAGRDAVAGGLTAAHLDGLDGFPDPSIHLIVPASRQVRKEMPGVVAHRSRLLGPADVHPVRSPPRTRLPRSVIDAASWMATDNGARAVLAAAVQQRLVRAEDLAAALGRQPEITRRALIAVTLRDVAGGAHALSELDFCRLTRRYRLPEPDRQVIRTDDQGRRRWLDAHWEKARLVAEVDGLWHMDALAWWADMRRDNELTLGGHRVLRFPAFAVREQPAAVAAQLRAALATSA